MFRLTRPTPAALEAFLEAQRSLDLSYPELGATHPERPELPRGYAHDHSRFSLGSAEGLFERASTLLARWTPYEQPWLELYPPQLEPRPGAPGCVLARHLGFYSLSAFRVVYRLETPHRFAFAIGTLPGHVERGEERFMLERTPDGLVHLDILAFSRPGHPLVRLGYPLARRQQKRFARGAGAALGRALTRSGKT